MSATQRSKMRLGRATRGFVLPAAIFLLVVLAALGAAIVTVSTTQQIGSALDVQGTRAYQAARAGIEWGLYQVQSTTAYNFSYGQPPTTVGAANPNLRACPASPSSFVPAAPTLAGFTVTVTCTATYDPSPVQTPTPASCNPASVSPPYDSTRCGPTVFNLTATACNVAPCPNSSPNSFYVERQMTVTF